MSEGASKALADLLAQSGAQDLSSQCVTFTGRGDLYPTRFQIGHVTAVAYGAAWITFQPNRALTLNLDHAALLSEGYRHVRLNGESVVAPRDPLTGFYKTADGRQIFLHMNFPHHQARALALLRAKPTREALASAILEWIMPVLDGALMSAGAVSAPVLTSDEWRHLVPPLPLVTIEKIAEGVLKSKANLRVVDFTRVLAGPTCGRFLAEQGANVLRIDNPLYPDLLSYKLDANRNKDEETLDLRMCDQQDKLLQKIKQADVFLQAYRTGVAEQYGLDAHSLSAQHEGLIHASLTAYDADTIFAGRRGFDSAVQAASGLALAHGSTGPKLLQTSPLDYAAGFLLAFGISLALNRRAREGGSYRVHTSLARIASWLLDMQHDHVPSDNPQRMKAVLETYFGETDCRFGRVRHIISPNL